MYVLLTNNRFGNSCYSKSIECNRHNINGYMQWLYNNYFEAALDIVVDGTYILSYQVGMPQ